MKFEKFEDFELLKKGLDCDKIVYELGNCLDCIDFYANYIDGKDFVLMLRIEVDISDLDEIEPIWYKQFEEGIINETELINEIDPEEVFVEFPEKAEILEA